MAMQVVVSSQADEDIAEARLYFGSIGDEISERFVIDVVETLG